ncbi:MAG: DUF4386 family protein [Leptospiraceae bacterium]
MNTSSKNDFMMADAREARTGFLIVVIVHLMLMHIAYFILTETFQFPEILRKPPNEMLNKFAATGELNRFAYYLFTLSGLTFALAYLFMGQSLYRKGYLATTGAFFAVLAGLMQALGFGRWVFLVPWIADLPVEKQQEALLILEAFHRYAGLLVGENLAFLAHGIGGAFMSVQILKNKSIPQFFGWVGLPIHTLIGIYSLEQFGGVFSGLGPFNIMIQILWLSWLLFSAIYMFRGRNKVITLQRRDFGAMALVTLILMVSALG